MAARKILLVEGDDDWHVLKHLCGNRGVPALDEIKRHEGVEQLLEGFPVRLRASEDGDIVGVVIDADTDLSSRWRSLRDHLIRVGYKRVPEAPAPGGTILDAPSDALLPRVGIWIMPDNQTKGILEDFLRFLVPDGSLLFQHVLSSVAAIPEDERRFAELAEPKAIIHTWPGRRNRGGPWEQPSGPGISTLG